MDALGTAATVAAFVAIGGIAYIAMLVPPCVRVFLCAIIIMCVGAALAASPWIGAPLVLGWIGLMLAAVALILALVAKDMARGEAHD